MPTPRYLLLVLSLATTALGGCTACGLKVAGGPETSRPLKLAAAKRPATEVVARADNGRGAWCRQRHLDYQNGKAPGGAKSLNQKMADDRTCARGGD